jgi:hypothetical protein
MPRPDPSATSADEQAPKQRGGSRGPVLIPADVLAQRPPFARALAEHRIAAGLSQMALAKLTGIPQASIADYLVVVGWPQSAQNASLCWG